MYRAYLCQILFVTDTPRYTPIHTRYTPDTVVGKKEPSSWGKRNSVRFSEMLTERVTDGIVTKDEQKRIRAEVRRQVAALGVVLGEERKAKQRSDDDARRAENERRKKGGLAAAGA